jgi:hypothetical protein
MKPEFLPQKGTKKLTADEAFDAPIGARTGPANREAILRLFAATLALVVSGRQHGVIV